jgi:hypothetical protein
MDRYDRPKGRRARRLAEIAPFPAAGRVAAGRLGLPDSLRPLLAPLPSTGASTGTCRRLCRRRGRTPRRALQPVRRRANGQWHRPVHPGHGGPPDLGDRFDAGAIRGLLRPVSESPLRMGDALSWGRPGGNATVHPGAIRPTDPVRSGLPSQQIALYGRFRTGKDSRSPMVRKRRRLKSNAGLGVRWQRRAGFVGMRRRWRQA